MTSSSKKIVAPKFLSGWKEIADYLGHGVRTVQRYEREMGLPVRRPAGKSRAAVVATKAELDAWVAASPYRGTFSLPLAKERASFAASMEIRLKEMQRLHDQMAGLRSDLRASLALLRETIQSTHGGINRGLGRKSLFSIRDFDTDNKAVFDLIGTQTSGKVS